MPALSYKKRFADLVESGKKRQTIRSRRKVPFKPDDILYHYYGMRTSHCRRLGVSTCASADVIKINVLEDDSLEIVVNDRGLRPSEIYALAVADGFKDEVDMRKFFEDFSPFEGQLIKWNRIEK